MSNPPDRPRHNPRSPARRETVQVLLTPDLHAVLRARAAENGETVSALGARLLEAGLGTDVSTVNGRAVFESLAEVLVASQAYTEAVKNLADSLKRVAPIQGTP